MVKASSVYLFIGQDSISKEARLKKIKEEFLSKGIEQFSFDTLYAKDFNLKQLQERLLFFPFKSPKRIIVIKILLQNYKMKMEMKLSRVWKMS